MKILGLDLSTVSTGVVVLENNCILHQEVIKYKMLSKPDDIDKAKRIEVITSRIVEIIYAWNIDVIGIEDVFIGRNRKTAKILIELHGAVKCMIYEETSGVPISVSPSELRKLVFGKSVKKIKVIPLLAEIGYHFDNEDEADACVVAMGVQKLLKGG